MSINTGDNQARSRFQNALLTWLRAGDPLDHANGLREMIAVTRSLAVAGQDNGADGLLWRSAGSFLQALLDGSLATDDEVRGLCRRLERHLASPEESRSSNADALAGAIFAFVSNRLPAAPAAGELADRAPSAKDKALNTLLGDAFSSTADVLPLLGNATPRRLNEQQLGRWKTAVAALRQAWRSAEIGQVAACRPASIALLQLTIELADAPSLQLAEAFAEAGGAAEDSVVRALPGFRAAFAAGLELAEHPDGPDQKGFGQNVVALSGRLAGAAIPPKGGGALVCTSTPWFAEDAREVLVELAVALDAVPPKRLALLAGFDWFIQHDSGRVMAIRGLATTAHGIIGQIRGDDLDQPATHDTINRAIDALRHAIDELASGLPPRADEAVFGELRSLDEKIKEQRRQAIQAAKMTNGPTKPPSFGEA